MLITALTAWTYAALFGVVIGAVVLGLLRAEASR